MADNVSITAGSGTTVASDDISGVHYPRAKLSLGADGSATDAIGGAGAVTAGVQRVTLASDDPAVGHVSRLTSSAGPTAPGAALSTTSFMVGARFNSSPPTFTNGQEGGLQITANGRLITNDANVDSLSGAEYETVAASQTSQVLGSTGATGDRIYGVLVIPATTSPGNVILIDNATSITIFTGGASSVSNLVPFMIPLGIRSVSGAWRLTTGANVSCIAIGDFT